ncbi:MAPEG family protein [Alkalimarinus coralli]|uniref:MAPEG family protein n=1 Tax=Alkalimarinus coralli TaxID=2935863 RepID=UPI00202B50BE|nr:MAPEG family protein [Alkalimarinus coralli]
MSKIDILYPVLAHVLLVVLLYIPLVIRKAQAVKSKAVDLKVTALNNQAWTEDVIKVSNNIANQFETPILFYVLCIIAVLTSTVDMLGVVLAWSYVALRYIHSYIHTHSNYVPYRMRVFALSLLILLIMLINTVVQLVNLT